MRLPETDALRLALAVERARRCDIEVAEAQRTARLAHADCARLIAASGLTGAPAFAIALDGEYGLPTGTIFDPQTGQALPGGD